jgi:hypothetical protein
VFVELFTQGVAVGDYAGFLLAEFGGLLLVGGEATAEEADFVV